MLTRLNQPGAMFIVVFSMDVPDHSPWKLLAESRYSSHNSSLYACPEALREVARKFDEDDLTLRLLLLDLRARRNIVCAPIMILPDDILSLIFEFLCSVDPPRPPGRLNRHSDNEQPAFSYKLEENLWGGCDISGSLGWYTVTHVCRRWRNHTLRQTRLWAMHIGLLPRALETVLSRCGNHRPLKLQIKKAVRSHRDHDTPAAWEILARLHEDNAHSFNMSRIRSIHVVDTDYFSTLENPSREFLAHELAEVEEVCLQGVTGCAYHSEWHETPTSTLEEWHTSHPALLSPRLHTLYLENTFIPFTANNLTRLSLRRTCFEFTELLTYNTCEIPQSVFLDTLRQARHSLKFLDIALFIPAMVHSHSEDTVDFANLEELRLHDEAGDLAIFFPLITFPTSTRLSVIVALDDKNKIPAQATSVLRTAISRIGGYESPKGLVINSSLGTVYAEDIHTFSIYPDSIWEDVVYGASLPSHALFAPAAAPLTLGISSCPAPAAKPPHRGRVIRTISEIVDLSQTRVLSLNVCHWAPSTISDTLAHFTGLHVLHVHNPIQPDLPLPRDLGLLPFLPPQAVSITGEHAANNPNTPPPLNLLWFDQDVPDSSSRTIEGELESLLDKCLLTREQAATKAGVPWGTPIQNLRVNCIYHPGYCTTVENRALEVTRRLVPTVEWRAR